MGAKTEYDVVLSFAGEDRERARELFRALSARGVKVFYDDDDKAVFWGEDLYSHLSDLYENRARFCVMLLSKAYAEKRWTNRERQAAQARAFRENGPYILPVRLDDSTRIPGILETVGCLSWPPESAESIANAVVNKLGAYMSEHDQPPKVPKDDAKHSIYLFQQRLEKLYQKANKGLATEYIYSYLCRTVGYLCKQVGNKKACHEDFIRPIAWTFAFASKVGCDLGTSFFKKYPACCPNCVETPCVCLKTGKKPSSEMPAYKVQEELEGKYHTLINSKVPLDFQRARVLITSIYPNNEVIWHYAGPWHHFAKLHEEVAEIHEAFSAFSKGEKPIGAVSEELANLLAWLIGAWHIGLKPKSMDWELLDYYQKGCPVCHAASCMCKPYSGRPDRLVDSKLLESLKARLLELQSVIPCAKDDIAELARSASVAVDTKSDVTGRLLLAQIQFKLERIRRDVPPDEADGKTGLLLIATILNLIERCHR